MKLALIISLVALFVVSVALGQAPKPAKLDACAEFNNDDWKCKECCKSNNYWTGGQAFGFRGIRDCLCDGKMTPEQVLAMKGNQES